MKDLGKEAVFKLKLIYVPYKIKGNQVIRWEALGDDIDKSPITGNDILREITTDTEGNISFKGLEEGIYEVCKMTTDKDYDGNSLRRFVEVIIDSKTGREVVTLIKDEDGPEVESKLTSVD